MRLRNRRVLGATVLALGAALVLAGCGAGQITQTDKQQPAVNGAYAQAEKLYIRNASLQFPPNGTAYAVRSSAALSLTIVNDGTGDEELRSVSSDAADGAAIQGSTLVATRSTLVITPTGTWGQPSASSLPAPALPSPTTSSSAARPAQVGRAAVVLLGLKRVVWPGQTVRVTLVFRDAGPVTVELPVAAPDHGGPGEVRSDTGAATSQGR